MNPNDRCLLALLAVFAPGRAERLLTRLGLADVEPLRAEGIRVASETRPTRLRRLAGSLPAPGVTLAARAGSLTSGERPRLAALLCDGLGAGVRGPRRDAIRPALRRVLEAWLRDATG